MCTQNSELAYCTEYWHILNVHNCALLLVAPYQWLSVYSREGQVVSCLVAVCQSNPRDVVCQISVHSAAFYSLQSVMQSYPAPETCNIQPKQSTCYWLVSWSVMWSADQRRRITNHATERHENSTSGILKWTQTGTGTHSLSCIKGH